MALQMRVVDCTGLDPAIAALYVPDGSGGYCLDIEGGAGMVPGTADAEAVAREAALVAERDTFRALAEERGTLLDTALIDAAIGSSVLFSQIPDPIYREHLTSRVRSALRVTDGVVTGCGQDGTPFAAPNGTPLTGDALLETLVASVPDAQRYFAGSSAAGSGACPLPPPGTADTPQRFAACRTPTEKAAYLDNERNLKRL